MFWHVDYEGDKTRGAGEAQIASVPIPAQFASITDPTSLALLKQYNIPTSPTGQVEANAPNTLNSYQVSYRGDVDISSNDTLWVRYGVCDSQQSSSSLTFINNN